MEERDKEAVEAEELDELEGELRPDRENMTVLTSRPHLVPEPLPIDPSVEE